MNITSDSKIYQGSNHRDWVWYSRHLQLKDNHGKTGACFLDAHPNSFWWQLLGIGKEQKKQRWLEAQKLQLITTTSSFHKPLPWHSSRKSACLSLWAVDSDWHWLARWSSTHRPSLWCMSIGWEWKVCRSSCYMLRTRSIHPFQGS